MRKTPASLPISEVTRLFDIRASALRYYEEIALLTPTARQGGRRHYGRSELKRLVLIQLLQDAGQLSLSEIADVLANDATDAARLVLTNRVATLERQIEEARAAKRYLEHRLTCPRRDPVNQCPVLDDEVSQWLEARLEASTVNAPSSGTSDFEERDSTDCAGKRAARKPTKKK